MDISIFETFLTSQKEGFATFLKGCKDVDRNEMRTALSTHQAKMTFILSTEFPIQSGRSVSSPFKSPTPHRAAKETTPSAFKSPAPISSIRSASPPGSNKAFKPPSPLPEFTRSPSIFKRRAGSSSATPANTPTSKKNPDAESAKSSRVPSGRRGGMTIGGAGRLFKPVTPKGKNYAADDSDSSAGSPIEKDPYYSKCATSASKQDKKSKAPPSPFEVAARAAEINAASKARKQAFVESESSASDFELPTRSTLRKVSSAKNQMDGREKATPKKTLADQMDIDGMYHGFEKDENMWENPQETPSKKQKTGANGGADHKLPTELN